MTIATQLLTKIIEAAIMAANKPLTIQNIQQLFDPSESPSKATIVEVLSIIALTCEDRGFELIEVASGWRFQVRQELSVWVGKLWEEKPQKYSRATLETLALIAYRQPITRGDIEDVRGVAVSSQIIRALLERSWIKVVGHKDVPGRPAMYATTREFLDYFALKSLENLPILSEIRDLDAVNDDVDPNNQERLQSGDTEALLDNAVETTANPEETTIENRESSGVESLQSMDEVASEENAEDTSFSESLGGSDRYEIGNITVEAEESVDKEVAHPLSNAQEVGIEEHETTENSEDSMSPFVLYDEVIAETLVAEESVSLPSAEALLNTDTENTDTENSDAESINMENTDGFSVPDVFTGLVSPESGGSLDDKPLIETTLDLDDARTDHLDSFSETPENNYLSNKNFHTLEDVPDQLPEVEILASSSSVMLNDALLNTDSLVPAEESMAKPEVDEIGDELQASDTDTQSSSTMIGEDES